MHRQVLPDLEKGALASLLADKVYEDKSSKETYYITGFIMPNNLSVGLQYLTFVYNEAIHILFQLLLWAQEKIDEGFLGPPIPASTTNGNQSSWKVADSMQDSPCAAVYV